MARITLLIHSQQPVNNDAEKEEKIIRNISKNVVVEK
jgi:hypothetical protein